MNDWKNFRLSRINSPEYNHLYLLLYWIIYLVAFQGLEHWTNREYNILHCFVDDYIPFNEYFVIPYLFWFVYMFSMSAYLVFFDRSCFIYYMKLIMITSAVACISYAVYPSALELRPTVFQTDNIFTKITKMIYDFDTSTNVCPSMHVTGSVVTMLAGLRTKSGKKPVWIIFHTVTTALITLSTVFMKQHSVIDVFWAIIVCCLAQWIVLYTENKFYNKKNDFSFAHSK